MKNAKYKYLAGHQILDLKKLTDERNESFQYNKAKTTIFKMQDNICKLQVSNLHDVILFEPRNNGN